MPDLPLDAWALAERRSLLTDSQRRLASVEGKGRGPGSRRVTAVVIAGAVLAIASGWHESTVLGRVILVAARGQRAPRRVARVGVPLPPGTVRPARPHDPKTQAGRDRGSRARVEQTDASRH